MSDPTLFAMGGAVTFTFLAGAYVYLRGAVWSVTPQVQPLVARHPRD